MNIYEQNIKNNQKKLTSVKQNLLISSMVRLVTFLIAVYLVYYFFGQATLVISICLGWITLFLVLLTKHTDLSNQKKYLETLIQINTNEIKALNGDLSAFDDGEEFNDPNHFFSYDIDLYGPESFFHHINRTNRKESKMLLAQILSSNDISMISEKQKAIKELANQLNWRQDFSVKSQLIESKVSSKSIFSWLTDYKPALPKFAYYFAVIFPLISLSIFAIYFLGFIPEMGLLYLLFTGLGITSIYLKSINLLSIHASEFKDMMKQYASLLIDIEAQTFTADLLKQKQSLIIEENHQKASVTLKELSKYINALDQRNNMFFGVIGNGYLLWDIKQAYKIEQWVLKNKHKVEQWFEVIEWFDTYNALANFAYNHKEFVYPELTKQAIIEAKALGHFMIDKTKRICNDVVIHQNEFIIITGANMAGKSTFLRTVALSIVSANVGLPVCALAFKYHPIKLITSMRTSDSLLDEESYFFSELKRLKFIVEEIQKDTYFIILDEILKGTNSKDKEEGSKQFIKRLVNSNSTGIIATHDLGLCEIEKELPQVKNKYFDAEILNNELYFDYTYKNGVCQNMNASFLLKKMGIV